MARTIISLPTSVSTTAPSSVQKVTLVYSGIVYSQYFSSTAIAPATPTIVATLTVPLSSYYGILRIDVTGQNTAVFDILIDSVLSGRQRTSYFNTFSNQFVYGAGASDALTLAPTSVLEVQVTNEGVTSSDFEVRIQYILTT